MDRHLVPVPEFSQLLAQGVLDNFVIVRFESKKWCVHFDYLDPLTKKRIACSIQTQRKEKRFWADPRVLTDFLSERGVREGKFLIEKGEHEHVEKKESV